MTFDDPYNLKLEDDPYLVGGAITLFSWTEALRRGPVMWTMGDAQGGELMNLWMSGRAPPEVTLDSSEWGDYMRAAPELQQQTLKQLTADAFRINGLLADAPGRAIDNYEASFHGEVGGKAGGYFTGYQLLHGSKRTDTLKDVQIFGRYTAARPKSGTPCVVTFEKLSFIWNDIITLNAQYVADLHGVRYARAANYFTGRVPPRDYVVHIKWKAIEAVTIDLSTPLKEFVNQ